MASAIQYDNLPPLPGDDAPTPRAIPREARNGIPEFVLKAVKRRDGTYMNVEYVNIRSLGDTRQIPCHKVTDEIRRKYAPWYDHWRRGLEVSPVGVPLEMWPFMTPALVMDLKQRNIFTVEQLCEVPDSALAHIPMGESLRRQAREWLKVKKDSDAVEQSVRERDSLLAANKLLERQMADLASRLDALASKPAEAPVPAAEPFPVFNVPDEAPVSRGPGRPRKE